MSLINDALKKAHKEAKRGDASPQESASSKNGANKTRGNNSGSAKWMGIITLVVAAGCAGLILIALIPEEQLQSAIASLKGMTQTAEAPAEPTPKSEVKQDAQEPTIVAEQTTDPEVVSSPPAKPIPEPKVAVSNSAADTTASTDVGKVLTEPATVEVDTTAITQDATILKAVYDLKIAAVIGRGKNARIMVDGQVYRIGGMLDFTLKYKFAGEKDGLLMFTDENGAVYERYI